MTGFNMGRLPRILLSLGLLTVAGLWIADEAGWLGMAVPADAHSAALPAGASLPLKLVLQGVIAGDRDAPGVAILAEAGKRPVLVPEGASFTEDVLVERVMADRVVLRQRSSGAAVVLPLSLMPGDLPLGGDTSAGRRADGAVTEVLPPPPEASLPAPDAGPRGSH